MTRIIAESPRASAARWPAVPAAVVLVLCVGLTIAVVVAGADPGEATLKARADEAVAAHDDLAAALHYRHLLAMRPDEPAYADALAQSLDRLGRRGEAMAVLNVIAPATGGGYAPAQLRQAEWLMEARVLHGASDPAVLAAARAHATAAAADPALNAQASSLLYIIDSADRAVPVR